MKQKKQTFINIGLSSILVIFVLLCLVTFATLSLVTANTDYRLSEKSRERSHAYYEACNEAERLLAHTDDTLLEIYGHSASEEDYLSRFKDTFDVPENQISYSIKMTDTQELLISIVPVYPKNSGDTFYEIESWKIRNTAEWKPDNSLNLAGD